MWWNSSELLSPFLPGNIVSTLALTAALLIARALALNVIRKWEAPSAALRRRGIAQARNATFPAFPLGPVIIWGSRIKEVAISLLAVAVAVVIAAKELILRLTGGILRTVSHHVQTGGRIEISGHRGDVIDLDPMTTTLLEVGPGQSFRQHTGRAVTVPNSLFLSFSVVDEAFTGRVRGPRLPRSSRSAAGLASRRGAAPAGCLGNLRSLPGGGTAVHVRSRQERGFRIPDRRPPRLSRARRTGEDSTSGPGSRAGETQGKDGTGNCQEIPQVFLGEGGGEEK